MALLKNPIFIALALLWAVAIIMLGLFVSPATAAWATFATWGIFAFIALMGYICTREGQPSYTRHVGQ